jgi:RNA polymerase sigma-70 factor (ECF subfamily)
VRNRDAAEDLVQETFAAALRARKEFIGASAERTWFIGILKHKIIDRLRAKTRELRATDLGGEGQESELFDERGSWRIRPADWPVRPAESLENREIWEVFRGCLEKLPAQTASAFSLREIEGLSADETCRRLTVTPGHLRVLLYRARMQLRRCFEVNGFQRHRDEV